MKITVHIQNFTVKTITPKDDKPYDVIKIKATDMSGRFRSVVAFGDTASLLNDQLTRRMERDGSLEEADIFMAFEGQYSDRVYVDPKTNEKKTFTDFKLASYNKEGKNLPFEFLTGPSLVLERYRKDAAHILDRIAPLLQSKDPSMIRQAVGDMEGFLSKLAVRPSILSEPDAALDHSLENSPEITGVEGMNYASPEDVAEEKLAAIEKSVAVPEDAPSASQKNATPMESPQDEPIGDEINEDVENAVFGDAENEVDTNETASDVADDTAMDLADESGVPESKVVDQKPSFAPPPVPTTSSPRPSMPVRPMMPRPGIPMRRPG